LSKFKIFIIILLIPLLVYLTGCTWEIFKWQKTAEKNLTESSENGSSQTNNSISSEIVPGDSENSSNALADNSSEGKVTVDSSSALETASTGEAVSENSIGNSGGDTVGDNLEPQRYAVIAGGASLDSQHYKWFLNSTNLAYKLLKNNGYTDENIYYFFENSKEPYVDYEATIDNFKKVSAELQKKATEKDNIVLFLIGHGSYRNANSYYSLNNYSMPDIELAELFKDIKRNKLVFVFSPCNSGGFVDNLSGKNTIVITSTRKDESNRAAFIEPFLISFDGIGDTDKDGKVSFEEAFNYACLSVREQFAANGWDILTEHAQLDDNGDKTSQEYPITDGGDGSLAGDTFLCN
jgi:hypothetical protein